MPRREGRAERGGLGPWIPRILPGGEEELQRNGVPAGRTGGGEDTGLGVGKEASEEEAGQWSRPGSRQGAGLEGGGQGVMTLGWSPDFPGPQEMVMLEIEVMNQLNHRNLIQLYAAIETPHDIILFLE